MRLKGTGWKLAFGGSVGIIEKSLACVQPELQSSYTRYRLQKFQNKAGRIITGHNYDMSATKTRLKLGWKD